VIFVGRRAALAFWYLVVPLALTAVSFGVLVPDAGDPRSGAALRLFARGAREQPLIVAAIASLLYGALVAYWSPYLPGARPIARAARGRDRLRIVLTLVAVVLAAIGGIASRRAVGTARIVSTSMVPTVLPGDQLWVDRFAYGSEDAPHRGDVIVFRRGGGDDDGDGDSGALVKRVIGVPGDHIEMLDSRPVVNGVPIPMCDAGSFLYFGATKVSRGRLAVEWLDDVAYLTVQEHGPHIFTGYDVRPGEVFVLGDDRGVSNDSRSWRAGPGVPLDAARREPPRPPRPRTLLVCARHRPARGWRRPRAAARRHRALPRLAAARALMIEPSWLAGSCLHLIGEVVPPLRRAPPRGIAPSPRASMRAGAYDPAE
jgi:signal peptidase I